MKIKSTFVLGALVLAAPALGEVMYWSDFASNRILRTDLETMSTEPLLDAVTPTRVAVDMQHQRIYWTGFFTGLWRANLDGSDPERIAAHPQSATVGVAVDPVAEKLYWATFRGAVFRAELDGTQRERIYSSFGVQDIALDRANGHLYVSAFTGSPGGSGTLRRINLDGSGLTDVVSDIDDGPIGVAADPASQQLYFARYAFGNPLGGLDRAAYDGAGQTPLLTGIDVDAVGLNPARDKLYFSTLDEDFTTGLIMRVNPDGSQFETLALPASAPAGFAIVPEPSSGWLFMLLGLGVWAVRGRMTAPSRKW